MSSYASTRRAQADLSPGDDPVARRLKQGLSGAAIVAVTLAVAARSIPPAVGFLVAALAGTNAWYRGTPSWRYARAHLSVALLAGTAMALPLDVPAAATAVALLLLVAAGAARPLTGPRGGGVWLVLGSLGASWAVISSARHSLALVDLPALALVLGGIWLGYSFVAIFVSTREKSLANLSAAIEFASAAEASARSARSANEELLARVTHDLRTPLAGIMGVCEILQMEASVPASTERIGLIRGSAGMMLHVVQDLLDRVVSQRSELEIRRVRLDLRQALEECVGLMSPLAREKGLALELSFPQAVPQNLVGDPVRLRQVLMNLLGNAVKFTRRGCVSVAVLELSSNHDRTAYRFEVSDTGPGLSADLEEILAASPERGESRDDSERGAGLGLQICRQLVKAMNGRLGANSSLGVGSTLWFELAFSADTFSSSPRLLAQVPVHSTSNVSPCTRVLVVEDDPVIARVLSEFFGLLGIAVDLAPSAAEGSAIYSPSRHDLVLVDLNLPDRLGSDLALDLRHRAAVAERIVILGMSADARLASWDSAEAQAFDDVLIKPIGLDQLREAVTDHFAAPGVEAGKRSRAPSAAEVNIERIVSLRELEKATQRPLLRTLVDSFARSAPALVEEIRGGAASGGREAVKAAAHKLRGSSGNIGADAVMNLAAEIEEASDSESSCDLAASSIRLKELVEQAVVALKAAI